eukprot:COSAG01_NODE_7400_length_3222_cov_2.875760_2_plen_84_part_00
MEQQQPACALWTVVAHLVPMGFPDARHVIRATTTRLLAEQVVYIAQLGRVHLVEVQRRALSSHVIPCAKDARMDARQTSRYTQ